MCCICMSVYMTQLLIVLQLVLLSHFKMEETQSVCIIIRIKCPLINVVYTDLNNYVQLNQNLQICLFTKLQTIMTNSGSLWSSIVCLARLQTDSH